MAYNNFTGLFAYLLQCFMWLAGVTLHHGHYIVASIKFSPFS